jgi:NAD(P)-dependent dehydrogenase (short-subunit alcohol dehydrogenase family)
MNFQGKTFWITGAASGMGKSVSVALSKYHTKLILSDCDADDL